MTPGGILQTTVDGRNPAPPDMYETLQIMRYLPYQLVQDFFHQQYGGVVFVGTGQESPSNRPKTLVVEMIPVAEACNSELTVHDTYFNLFF